MSFEHWHYRENENHCSSVIFTVIEVFKMSRKRELVEEEVLIKKAKPIMEKYKVTYGRIVSVDDQMGGSKRYGIISYFC